MAKFKELDKLLSRFAEKTVPGCACVIMKDGESIYEGYAGYADIENKIPIGEHSIFRQASTTKLFTYVICMMLFEQGEFLINEPLYEYLPEWRNTRCTHYVMRTSLLHEPAAQTEQQPDAQCHERGDDVPL